MTDIGFHRTALGAGTWEIPASALLIRSASLGQSWQEMDDQSSPKSLQIQEVAWVGLRPQWQVEARLVLDVAATPAVGRVFYQPLLQIR